MKTINQRFSSKTAVKHLDAVVKVLGEEGVDDGTVTRVRNTVKTLFN